MRSTAFVLFIWSCVALSAGETRFSGVAAIEAWLSARATVAGSVLSRGTANLDQVASVGSSLLRLAAVLLRLPGRLVLQFSRRIFISMLFVIGLGPSRNFRLSGNSYTCCRRGAPVGVARGGDLHAELAYGNHPSVCLLYTSPSPRDKRQSRMPSSA